MVIEKEPLDLQGIYQILKISQLNFFENIDFNSLKFNDNVKFCIIDISLIEFQSNIKKIKK